MVRLEQSISRRETIEPGKGKLSYDFTRTVLPDLSIEFGE